MKIVAALSDQQVLNLQNQLSDKLVIMLLSSEDSKLSKQINKIPWERMYQVILSKRNLLSLPTEVWALKLENICNNLRCKLQVLEICIKHLLLWPFRRKLSLNLKLWLIKLILRCLLTIEMILDLTWFKRVVVHKRSQVSILVTMLVTAHNWAHRWCCSQLLLHKLFHLIFRSLTRQLICQERKQQKLKDKTSTFKLNTVKTSNFTWENWKKLI